MRHVWRLIALLLAISMLTGLVFADTSIQPSAEAEASDASYAETIEAAEQTELNLATEQYDLPESTEATEPAEPSDPTEPTEPSEPSDPTEPTEPSEPSEPSDPTEPTEPAEPEPREDEEHEPFFSGYTDGTFRPNNSVTRAEIAKILYKLGDYPEAEHTFSDVPDGKWYTKAVNALAAAGIISGYSDGTFRPNDALNRAEFTALLRKLSGIEEASAPSGFSDVSENFWASKAIAIAREQGWVSGYPDGTFRPFQAVTRAETAVTMKKYLDRTPDREAIDSGVNIRFFPDVAAGSWYYYAVMEATASHTAHYETPDSHEKWQNVVFVSANLKDGFYCIGGKIYAAVNGDFVHTAQNGVLNGTAYTCTGASGVCRVDGELLTLANGDLILLNNGNPLYVPGKYPDGYYIRSGSIYAAVNGKMLNKSGSGTLGGVKYSCTGSSGVCTVQTEILKDVNGDRWHIKSGKIAPTAGLYEISGAMYCAAENGKLLRNADWNTLHFGNDCKYTSGNTTIDQYVDAIIADKTNSSMTQEAKLKACYNYVCYHAAKYRPNNDHVPRGQDCSLWAETYMLRLINDGVGNCYCFASELYYLARRIGYWQAKAISGGFISRGTDHGWIEIEQNGTVYACDPRGDYSFFVKRYNMEPGTLYMKPYSKMPIEYFLPKLL